MRWISRQHLTYVVVGITLAVVGWWAAAQPGDEAAGRSPVEVRTYAAPEVAPVAAEPVVVHVVGMVAHPGVYRLPAGSRVQSALRAAGGPRPGADLQSINLAARATDGHQIAVPRRGASASPGAAATGAPSSTPSSAAPISLSTATAEQLDLLDGIGPTLAARIIAYRDANGGFRSVDELTEVSGIGDARLEAIRNAVVP